MTPRPHGPNVDVSHQQENLGTQLVYSREVTASPDALIPGLTTTHPHPFPILINCPLSDLPLRTQPKNTSTDFRALQCILCLQRYPFLTFSAVKWAFYTYLWGTTMPVTTPDLEITCLSSAPKTNINQPYPPALSQLPPHPLPSELCRWKLCSIDSWYSHFYSHPVGKWLSTYGL